MEEYLKKIGGREAIFEQSEKAARGKKRGRQPGSQPASKRARNNGVHPAETAPPATKKKWTPPSGSWEDDIENIDACEEEGSGKLVVYLNWKNGQKTKHETTVIYKKCPQKVSGYLLLELVREHQDTDIHSDASVLRTTCQDHSGGE